MRSRLILKLCMLTLALLLVMPVLAPQMQVAAATNSYNITMNIPAMVVTNPCGTGDVVAVSGTVHTLLKVTSNNRGGYQTSVYDNYQGVSGQSTITGIGYQDTDIKQTSFTANPPFPYQYSWSELTNLVSQGSTDNFYLRVSYQATVNANGVPTVTLNNVQTACHG